MLYHQGREFVRYIKSVPIAICVKGIHGTKRRSNHSKRKNKNRKKKHIKIQKSNNVNDNNNSIKKARNYENDNDNNKANDIKNTAIIYRGGGVGVGGLKDFGCFRTKTSLIPL